MAERATPVTGHLELQYPSEYVKAADLRGRDVTVVIDKLVWADLVMEGGKKDRKVTIHMRSVGGKRLEKRWVVGKTVLRQIGAALGDPITEHWPGKSVTMFPDRCKARAGGLVDCIRVRVRVNASAAEVTEEMAATPAPRAEFLDEAEATEEPAAEPKGAKGSRKKLTDAEAAARIDAGDPEPGSNG